MRHDPSSAVTAGFPIIMCCHSSSQAALALQAHVTAQPPGAVPPTNHPAQATGWGSAWRKTHQHRYSIAGNPRPAHDKVLHDHDQPPDLKTKPKGNQNHTKLHLTQPPPSAPGSVGSAAACSSAARSARRARPAPTGAPAAAPHRELGSAIQRLLWPTPVLCSRMTIDVQQAFAWFHNDVVFSSLCLRQVSAAVLLACSA